MMNIGDRLPNGAIVLQIKPASERGNIVLAYTFSSWTPWVTWAMPFGPDSTSNGHYHPSLREALDEFDVRC